MIYNNTIQKCPPYWRFRRSAVCTAACWPVGGITEGRLLLLLTVCKDVRTGLPCPQCICRYQCCIRLRQGLHGAPAAGELQCCCCQVG
jgi:hypothetical protein